MSESSRAGVRNARIGMPANRKYPKKRKKREGTVDSRHSRQAQDSHKKREGVITKTMTEDVLINSNRTFTERFILSAFPVLSTHSRHDPNSQECSGEIFPHDVILAALAVFYCRYTVYSKGERMFFRVFWASLLAYLAYERYSYWILGSVHVLSFGEYTWNHIVNKMSPTKVSERDVWFNLILSWIVYLSNLEYTGYENG